MIFKALASSSSGNAYIVDDGETRILLECGLSHTKLQKLCGFKLSAFHGVFVSHEHKDHSKCAKELVGRGLEVFMSQGTADALEIEGVTIVADMEQINVGTLDVVPFATFHDAREPLGFLIKSRRDGDVLAFATDTVNLRYQFPGLTILAIEANYDKHILERCERMPEKVRYRITNSHMEIDTLCGYLRELDLTRCREIHLLHLSDATSHEGHFITKVTHIAPPWVTVAACEK